MKETNMQEKSDLNQAEVQAHIDEIQALYREWNAIVPKLREARLEWDKGMQIMDKLSKFYFGDHYMKYLNAMENGMDIDQTTEGEYCIMGQDTLWDAMHEQHDMAWAWLRAGMLIVDPKNNG